MTRKMVIARRNGRLKSGGTTALGKWSGRRERTSDWCRARQWPVHRLDDMLYAIDSESNPTRHAGWRTGIHIGKATEDKVTAFIPPHMSKEPQGVAGEGVAVDREGNVYAAEGPISRPDAGGGLTKYLK